MYSILPLDEPVFTIDTNTRKITVPADFVKNGVSVQGDQVSEVLYFTVDRYADAMDLYREDIHIGIQWEAVPTSKNHPAQKGFDEEWVRDIKTYAQDGKMLFGWAIDPRATEYPCSIKFSVRFYHFDSEGKIDFNLNTLATTVGVLASIDYDVMDSVNTEVGAIVNKKNFLLNRLMDSPTPPGIEAPPAPAWIEGFDIYGTETVFEITDKNGNVHKCYDLDNGERVIIVKATASTGSINYQWYWKALDGIDWHIIPDANYTFIKTADKVYSSQYPYYIRVEEKPEDALGEVIVKYQVVTDITSEMHGKDITHTQDLYEKVGYCKIGQTGDYKVIAVNSMGLGWNETLEEEQFVLRIPGPDVDSFILEYGNGQTENIIMDIASGEVMLEAVSRTNRNGDVVKTVWSEIDPETESIIQEFETSSKIMDNTIDYKNETHKVELGEEDYRSFDKTFIIEATAIRNKDEVEYGEPLKYRVTAPAQELSVKRSNENAMIPAGKAATFFITVEQDGTVSDSVTYQWYRQRGEFDGDNPSDEYEDILIEGATNSSLSICDEGVVVEGAFDLGRGYYYCIVTNHVNGTTCSQKADSTFVNSYM